MTGVEKPTPRVRQHVVTAMVDGHPRHRILGIHLRPGQNLDPDVPEHLLAIGIAEQRGLDPARLPNWWWFVDFADLDVVTPERLAKGDLQVRYTPEGAIDYAERIDGTVFRKLLEREVLDERHRHYGMVFLDLRRYFRRQADFRGNNLYALEFLSTSTTGDPETEYLRVCRRIAGKTEKAVLYSLETPAEGNWPFAWAERHAIVAAFEKLAKDIDEVREEMRKEEEERLKREQERKRKGLVEK
jgi:hypothetical protein